MVETRTGTSTDPPTPTELTIAQLQATIEKNNKEMITKLEDLARAMNSEFRAVHGQIDVVEPNRDEEVVIQPRHQERDRGNRRPWAGRNRKQMVDQDDYEEEGDHNYRNQDPGRHDVSRIKVDAP